MKSFLAIIVLFISFHGYSQEDIAEVNHTVQIDTIKIDSTLISGKNIAIVEYREANDFDKKWMEAWNNSIIDSSLIILPEDTIGKVVIDSLSTDLLKKRLEVLNSKTPFNVEYKLISTYFKIN